VGRHPDLDRHQRRFHLRDRNHRYGVSKMNLVDRARKFAAFAHRNHTRKYTHEPYVNHLAEVAELVRNTGAADEAVAAAWLHDTVEDVGVSHSEIAKEFGSRVAELVFALTDPVSTANRSTRKNLSRKRLAAADTDAHTIKYADMLSNGRSIFKHDPNFAKVYLVEMRDLFAVLTKGDAALRNSVAAMLERKIK
jgi:guanosine-3',5'-bis(diphosphate) 3'-pyrophosphohydrolase